MLAIIFAFIAFFCWSFGDVGGAVSSRKIGGYSATFWVYFLALVFTSFYVPFVIGQPLHISFTSIILVIILNIIGPIPVIAFFEGLRVGNASLVTAISASFAALTVVLSVIFLGDRLTFIQTVFVTVVFIGVILSSFNIKDLQSKKIFTDKGVPFALVALVVWAIYFTFIRIPVREIGWFWPSYLTNIGFIFVYLIMRIKKIPLQFIKTKYNLGILILTTVLGQTAIFAYNYAIIQGQTAIVAPIAGSYPAFGVLLMYLVFKDKITKQQITGIIITLIGIVLLSLFSQ